MTAGGWSHVGPGPGDTFAEQAVALVRERADVIPSTAIVLGSGLGDAVSNDLRVDHDFSYSSLPGFPPASVRGHAGRLMLGELYGVPAAVFKGRVHLYEGHGIQATTLIPRIAAALGARTLILTNAAGGLDASLRRGQLMLIGDHLNFLGVNPLTGWRFPDGQPAFVDLSQVYDPKLAELALVAARQEGLELARGVYAAVPGPSYETPSETAFLRGAGASAVGMSTVPEAVAGKALGLRVLGVSCVTNMAGTPGNHEDVLAAAGRASGTLRDLLERLVPRLSDIARDTMAGAE